MENKMKFCQIGRHSTPMLFWRKGTPKNPEGLSACNQCAAKYMIKTKPNLSEAKEATRAIKKPKPITKMSDKMKIAQRTYLKARLEYLNKNPKCEFQYCNNSATDIHHITGRTGKMLCDTDNFMAICRGHHTWIHENDAEARELGYLKSRLEK